jgi:hypothetical protein
MYLSWPALWGGPVEAFFERVIQSIDFEPHYVLFEGVLYQSDNLPWRYVPSLLIRQLTEPLMIGMAIGLILILMKREKICHDAPFVLIPAIWFIIPFGAQLLLKFSIYGNFRQLLFMTPPLFMLGALGWEGVLRRIPRISIASMIVGLVLLPIIYQVIYFHPYEYVYYNMMTGGVTRASGKFPLDYWCTSYREGIEWINRDATAGSQVRVYGPDLNPRTFARDDLEIVSDWQSAGSPEYSMLCTSIYPRPGVSGAYSLADAIGRGGVPLTLIYIRQ